MAKALTLGFSPCPNDTFMFAALVNGWIDTKGLTFESELADIETLNEWAGQGRLDITKLSFNRYYSLSDQYRLLSSGAALGRGCGPLLVARQALSPESIDQASIALPGVWTTAHLLFSVFYPNARDKRFMVFHEIEEAVSNGSTEAGVIIHENRFTYEDKGLVKITDLGETWEQETGLPIPLGGIFSSAALDAHLSHLIEELIRESILFARRYPEKVMPYVRAHAQEMEDSVMQAHIDLYVNDFSLDLGDEGHTAILRLKNKLPG